MCRDNGLEMWLIDFSEYRLVLHYVKVLQFCSFSVSWCLYDVQKGAQFVLFSPVVAPQQACINMAAGSNIVQAAAMALASVVAPFVDLDPTTQLSTRLWVTRG